MYQQQIHESNYGTIFYHKLNLSPTHIKRDKKYKPLKSLRETNSNGMSTLILILISIKIAKLRHG